MNELLNKLQRYIKAYKEPPYGKEVEGTTELMEEAFQALVKTSHRVVLLENQFIDGIGSVNGCQTLIITPEVLSLPEQ